MIETKQTGMLPEASPTKVCKSQACTHEADALRKDLHKKNSLLAELFFTFLKIGLFTFGGGYAMIGIIEGVCVEQKAWITHDEMMDITVIAESTPGPIAINCATFVGYKQAGMAGGVAATVGVVVPSFVIIYAISMFLSNFLEIGWVASAFRGIQVAVGVLIVNAAVNMVTKQRMMLKKAAGAPANQAGVARLARVIFPKITVLAAFAAMLLANVCGLRLSSITLMLIAAAASIALCFAEGRAARKGGEGK